MSQQTFGFWDQWHQLDHMQTICTSLQTDHTNTPSLNFLEGGCSSWHLTNSVIEGIAFSTALGNGQRYVLWYTCDSAVLTSKLFCELTWATSLQGQSNGCVTICNVDLVTSLILWDTVEELSSHAVFRRVAVLLKLQLWCILMVRLLKCKCMCDNFIKV